MDSSRIESDPNQLRTSLLDIIRPHFNHESIGQIVAACNLALRAHKDQTRDDKKTPYIIHPFGVARRLATDLVNAPRGEFPSEDLKRDIIIAALLHDVLEDAPRESVIASDLDTFGKRVRDSVECLTWDKTQRAKSDYLNSLRQCPPHVRLVKLADRLDNLEAVPYSPEPGKQAKMAQETLDHILPLGANSEFELIARYAVRAAGKIRELEGSVAMAARSLAWEIVLPAGSRLLEWLPDLEGFLDCTSRLNILTSHERLLKLLLIVQAAKRGVDSNDGDFSDNASPAIGLKIRGTGFTKEERLKLIATELKVAGVELRRSNAVAALENFCFQLAFEEETLALEALLEVLEACIAGPRSDYASSLDNICDAVAKYLGRGSPDDRNRAAGWLIVLPRRLDGDPLDTNGAIVGASASLTERVNEILPTIRFDEPCSIPITASGNDKHNQERLVFGYLIACQPKWAANDRRNDQASFAASILGEFIASDIIKSARLLGFMLDRNALFQTRATYATVELAARLHHMWLCSRKGILAVNVVPKLTDVEDVEPLEFLEMVCELGGAGRARIIREQIETLLAWRDGEVRRQFQLADLVRLSDLPRAGHDLRSQDSSDVFTDILLRVSGMTQPGETGDPTARYDQLAERIAVDLKAESCAIFFEEEVGVVRRNARVSPLRAMVETGSHGALSNFGRVARALHGARRPMNYLFFQDGEPDEELHVLHVESEYGMDDTSRGVSNTYYNLAGTALHLNGIANSSSGERAEVFLYDSHGLGDSRPVSTASGQSKLPTTLQIREEGLPRLANSPQAMDSLSQNRQRRGKVDQYNYPFLSAPEFSREEKAKLRGDSTLAPWYDPGESGQVPLRKRVLRGFMAVPIFKRVEHMQGLREHLNGLDVVGIIKVENSRANGERTLTERLEAELATLNGEDRGDRTEARSEWRQNVQESVADFNFRAAAFFRPPEARRLAEISSCFRIGEYFKILRRLPRPTVSCTDVNAIRVPEGIVDGYLRLRGEYTGGRDLLKAVAIYLKRLLDDLNQRMQFQRAVGLLKNEGAASVLGEDVISISTTRVKDLDSLIKKLRSKANRHRVQPSSLDQERIFVETARSLSPFWAVIRQFVVDDIVAGRVVTEYLEDVEMVVDHLLDMLGGCESESCASGCWNREQLKTCTECLGRVAKIERADGDSREKDRADKPKDYGYRGIHVTLYVPCKAVFARAPLSVMEPCFPRCVPVELQVRTENQHAWAQKAHHLAYKEEAGLEATAPRLLDELKLLSNILHDGDQMSDIVRHNVLHHLLGANYSEWELRRRLRDVLSSKPRERIVVLKALGFLKSHLRYARNDIGFPVVQHSLDVALVLAGELTCTEYHAIAASLLHEKCTIDKITGPVRITSNADEQALLGPVKRLLRQIDLLYERCGVIAPRGTFAVAYREAVAMISRGGPADETGTKWDAHDRRTLFYLMSAFIVANFRELATVRHRLRPESFKAKRAQLRLGYHALMDTMPPELRSKLACCIGLATGEPEFYDAD